MRMTLIECPVCKTLVEGRRIIAGNFKSSPEAIVGCWCGHGEWVYLENSGSHLDSTKTYRHEELKVVANPPVWRFIGFSDPTYRTDYVVVDRQLTLMREYQHKYLADLGFALQCACGDMFVLNRVSASELHWECPSCHKAGTLMLQTTAVPEGKANGEQVRPMSLLHYGRMLAERLEPPEGFDACMLGPDVWDVADGLGPNEQPVVDAGMITRWAPVGVVDVSGRSEAEIEEARREEQEKEGADGVDSDVP